MSYKILIVEDNALLVQTLEDSFVVGPARSLEAVPQVLARGHHLAHRIARPQRLAQLAEGSVRHARHGGDEQTVRQRELAYVHGGTGVGSGC